MAVFETSRALTEGVRTNPASGITRLFGAVLAWNDRRTTRNALNALTERELHDIGLSRSDLSNL